MNGTLAQPNGREGKESGMKATRTMSDRRQDLHRISSKLKGKLGARSRRALFGMALTGTILVTAVAPVAAMTTYSASGAVGPLLTPYPSWKCSSVGYSVESRNTDIGRTPKYPYANQKIQMWVRLDWSGNNRDWYVKEWRGPSEVTTAPGQYAPFRGVTFLQLPRYHYYRVILLYRWIVNNVVVGEVWDAYNELDREGEWGVGHYSSNGLDNCYLDWTGT